MGTFLDIRGKLWHFLCLSILYGFCQVGQVAASTKDCQMTTF